MQDYIKTLEYIVETCKTLKEIKISPKPLFINRTNLLLQNDSFSNDAILKLNTRPNIKILNCEMYLANDFKNLTYIMRTFPQLRKFDLLVGNSHNIIDQEILTQLLVYLSTINCYSVRGLNVDSVVSTLTMSSYWNDLSTTGNEYVKISYCRWYSEAQTELELTKADKLNGSFIGLNYPISDWNNINWLHKSFIEKNGAYIHELLFAFKNSIYTRIITDTWELPENFFAHTFSSCPNLQCLYLHQCTLKQSPNTTIDLSKKYSLSELFIADCDLYYGMLEQLSSLLQNIKKLSLGRNWFRTSTYSQSSVSIHSYFEIIMPQTQIDVVAIERNFRVVTMYLVLYVLNDESHYYYRLDPFINNKFVVLSEEECLSVNDDQCIMYICCRNKPAFRVEELKNISFW